MAGLDVLAFLKAKKMWLVENFVVWGELGPYVFSLFYTEVGTQSNKRIMFDTQNLGGKIQSVSFGDLSDHRNNNLPADIKNPMVILQAKKSVPCIITSRTGTGFQVARESQGGETGLVDLLIVEME